MDSISAAVDHPAPTITRLGPRVLVESTHEYSVIEEVRPGIVAFHFEGWTTASHLPYAAAALGSALARKGSVVMITNGDGCSGCDTEVREFWTAWTKKHCDKIVAQHYFAPAAMMRMGLQMMSMESGAPIRLFKKLAQFESAVLETCPALDLSAFRARAR